jgi:hypothetical protein
MHLLPASPGKLWPIGSLTDVGVGHTAELAPTASAVDRSVLFSRNWFPLGLLGLILIGPDDD